MKSSVFILSLLCVAFMLYSVSAQTDVLYFHGIGCPHCAIVADSGVLEKVGNMSGVNLVKYEVYWDVKGQEKYNEMKDLLKLPAGIPLAIVNYSGEYHYLLGDKPIISSLEKYARGDFSSEENKTSFWGNLKNFISSGFSSHVSNTGKLDSVGWLFLIFGALIDSINPCAFGVLIFLMISLLSTGSSRRALRYGLIYTLVVFLVYFLVGLGIFRVIQSLPSMQFWISIIAATVVFIFAILEFVDFARAGKSDKKSVLKIPTSVKPLLESTARKGTLAAIIILGALVSLFELPCTGGIYLGVLKILSAGSFTSGLFYLLIYNLIFVLPLIVITWIVYKGTSPEILQRWTNSEKKWMKFAAGVVLILIGIYLLKGVLY
ncbi:MAG: cytochrome c biogenesis protein CcdA [archaeon]